MRAILPVGQNDLRLFLRNRASFVWLFVMPLAFVYFMGFANRGPGGPSSPRPTVWVDNADAGFLGRAFLEELGVQGLQVVGWTNGADARRGLRIPTNFTADVMEGRQGRVGYLSSRQSGEAAAVLVEIRVAGAMVAINAQLLEVAVGSGGQAATT